MKKIVLGLIVTLSISSLSFGQAVLEHSYSTSSTIDESSFSVLGLGITHTFYTNSGIHYYTFNNDTNVIKIFNSNHTSIKTINLPETPDKIIYLTDNLFNNDNSIEILYSVWDNIKSYYNIKLINEQGTIIQTIANRAYARVFKNDVNSYKLCVSGTGAVSPGGGTYQLDFDIYSLTGTLSTAQQEIYLKNSFDGYPNPTENIINITNKLSSGENGVLEIFDINGKKVIEKNVTGGNSEISLDVTALGKGVYVYRLNGQTNRFIKG